MAPRWAPWTTFLLSLVGLGVAGYLTIEHYSKTITLACADSGTINCAKVTTSSYAEVLGVPVALLGLLFFAALAVLCAPPLWRRERLVQPRLAAVVLGMVSVFYLVWGELEVGALCLWCTGVHVVTFGLFSMVLLAWALTEHEA